MAVPFEEQLPLIVPWWNADAFHALKREAGHGRRPMRVWFFAFLVFLGGEIFLRTFIADRQVKLDQEKQTIMKVPRSTTGANQK